MKVLLTTLLLLLLLAGCTQQNFKGVPLTPAKPAPDFTLTNQFGEEVSLSDFRGKVVVMSFLYTNCPTVCPIITSKFISAAEELGDSAGRDVVFVAVTVDPERDTTDKIRRYSEEKGMLDKWHYFTGGRVEVERVWSDYNIYVNKSSTDASGNYLVDHTATVIGIGKRGNLRLVFPGAIWDPKDLADDLRLLMKEE
ncbi:MAG: SCO family protein [Candidatus Hydrothermarchaeota archaeon]|nr:SCO family protein [Candidatus Hydrothermarchaeota archaeon]